MAKEMLTQNNLVLRYQVGVTTEGKDVFKQQSFKGISTDTTAEELLDLSVLVNEVIDFSISEVRKEQTFILVR